MSTVTGKNFGNEAQPQLPQKEEALGLLRGWFLTKPIITTIDKKMVMALLSGEKEPQAHMLLCLMLNILRITYSRVQGGYPNLHCHPRKVERMCERASDVVSCARFVVAILSFPCMEDLEWSPFEHKGTLFESADQFIQWILETADKMNALIRDPQVENGAPSFTFSMVEGQLYAAF